MAATLHQVEFTVHAGVLQQAVEVRGLAARDHIVRRAVENAYGRVVRADVGRGVQVFEGLFVPFEGKTHHSFLGRMVPGIHLRAAAHVVQVHGTGPVAGRIDRARERQVATHVAFQLGLVAGRGCEGSQMTARRET